MDWGHELKMHRKAVGISQLDLAEKIGVSSRTVCMWENGQRGMTLIHAEKAFGILGTEFVLMRKAK